MIRAITTFGFIGRVPVAPGTAGSLAAVPVAWLLHGLGGVILLIGATAAVVLLGIWAIARDTGGAADPDRSEIVIDEVAGQWIALFPLSAGLSARGAEPWEIPLMGGLVAFVLFRIFDILKPWPVSWADRQKTPLGVMLDDVLAGAMAALVIAGTAAVARMAVAG
ncbi:MAG: phosphatidylglycerophosphatase A [Pseudomonadota bacterium]